MLLEFVLAMIGIVALVYMTVQVWGWLNRMIVQRQAAYEGPQGARRLRAGQVATPKAERLAQFKPLQLKLLGGPLDTGPARALTERRGDPKAECKEVEADYKVAAGEFKEARRISKEAEPDDPTLGPIELLRVRMKEVGQQICESEQRQQQLADDCPDCLQHIEIDGQPYQLTVFTDAACVGPLVGGKRAHPSCRVHKNWARCAEYWFQAAAGEDDDDDRDQYLGLGHYCLDNVTQLQSYLQQLGDHIERLGDHASGLVQHGDWLVKCGEDFCLAQDEARQKGGGIGQAPRQWCQENLPKPDEEEPIIPPAADERIPSEPALNAEVKDRGCS